MKYLGLAGSGWRGMALSSVWLLDEPRCSQDALNQSSLQHVSHLSFLCSNFQAHLHSKCPQDMDLVYISNPFDHLHRCAHVLWWLTLLTFPVI